MFAQEFDAMYFHSKWDISERRDENSFLFYKKWDAKKNVCMLKSSSSARTSDIFMFWRLYENNEDEAGIQNEPEKEQTCREKKSQF